MIIGLFGYNLTLFSFSITLWSQNITFLEMIQSQIWSLGRWFPAGIAIHVWTHTSLIIHFQFRNSITNLPKGLYDWVLTVFCKENQCWVREVFRQIIKRQKSFSKIPKHFEAKLGRRVGEWKWKLKEDRMKRIFCWGPGKLHFPPQLRRRRMHLTRVSVQMMGEKSHSLLCQTGTLISLQYGLLARQRHCLCDLKVQ